MANNIHLILDSRGSSPLDISDFIMQQTEIREAPIYTTGNAGGTSKMGTPIYDRLETLYQFSVPLKPGFQSVYEQIERKIKANAFFVTFTSFRAASDITLYGQCTIDTVSYVQTVNRDGKTNRVYTGPTLTFEGYERS